MLELNARRLGVDATVAADYDALHDGAAFVELDRHRVRFIGAGARDALNGILTCDVPAIQVGSGAYGVALTPKGKVIADVTVYAVASDYLVEVPGRAWAVWSDMVSKFVNPRLARRVDETSSTGEIGVFGPKAAAAVASVLACDISAIEGLANYSHLEIQRDGTSVDVARIPDLGLDGFRMIGPREAVAEITTRIASRARRIGPLAVECARIEAGRPLWGVDMDESTLPQEANLDALNALSYTKGCYTGQEVVARLHFRGHVNRRLVGVRFDGATTPERGTEVFSGENACGDTRSSALSPRFGPIALAMIRREVDVGATLVIGKDGAELNGEVVALPFGG
jgi:folate-binding protein YgfZ